MTLLSAPQAFALGTPQRKVLMEEFTGTWCGFCPRGLAALEYMAEKYPDKFIGVSFHAPGSGKYDELTTVSMAAYPMQVESYPSARLDRGRSIDPYYGLDGSTGQFGLEPLWQEAMNQPTTAGISLTATHDATNPALINVETTTWFTARPAAAPKVIIYLIGDKVGEGMGLKQTNNMAGNSGSFIANMDRFTKGGPVIHDMTYDDVYLMGTQLSGVNLLPAQVEAQKDYTLTYQFDTSNCVNTEGRKVIDPYFDNFKVVVALLDASGNVINADMVRVPKRAPIYLNSVSTPATAELEVGATKKLDVTTDPSTVYDDKLLWMSSDPKVATVDKNSGLITGVAEGTCTITVLSSENSRVTSTTELTVTMPKGEYEFTLTPGKLRRGCCGVIDVNFKSSLDLKQLKFKVPVVGWFEISDYAAIFVNRTADEDVNYSSDIEGDDFVITMANVKAGEGPLVRIPILVKEDAGRDTDFSIKDIELTNEYGVALTLPGIMSAVTVKDMVPGDVNGSGMLDPDDLDLAADAVIGALDPTNVREAADFNRDGRIDVLDLTDMAFTLTQTDKPAEKQGISDPSSFSYRLAPLSIVPGKTRDYDINVAVKKGFIAAQFDVVMPDGFEINSIQAASSKHRAKIAKSKCHDNIGYNEYYGVIYSPVNAVMTSAQESPIASIRIAAPEQIAEGLEGVIKYTKVVNENFQKEDIGNASFAITEDTTGVIGIEAADGPIEVYTISGLRVADGIDSARLADTIEGLPAGLYIVRQGIASRKIAVM